jgi:hypothetical protein
MIHQSIYELGRLYFEMGYFKAAERIFQGLVNCDNGLTPSLLGLAVIKMEKGDFHSAREFFLQSLSNQAGTTIYHLQARLGLVMCLMALGEENRAKDLFNSLSTDLVHHQHDDREFSNLFKVIELRLAM